MMDVSILDMDLLFGVMDRDETGDVSYDEFVEQLHYMGTVNMLALARAIVDWLVSGCIGW